MNDDDDRFQEMKSLERYEPDEVRLPATSRSLVSRPVGAQHVAVKRNNTTILATIKALAAAAGDAWYYRWSVNTPEGKKWIEGPSIKLANDLARTYGNCDIDVWVEEDDRSWIFHAKFTDFETGFSMTRPFQQRKNQSSIKTGGDRQRDIAFQIGASKAIRNIVVNALQTYADYGLEEARNSLIEKIGKNLPGSRTRLTELLQEHKIELSRVERAIGRTLADMLAPDIAKVLAMIKMIDDGMATIDETFPHETIANPLGAQPEPSQERDPRWGTGIDHTPGAPEGGSQGDVDHARTSVGARQEPAGGTSGVGSPRQRASRKNAQAPAARDPGVKIDEEIGVAEPEPDGAADAKRQEDIAAQAEATRRRNAEYEQAEKAQAERRERLAQAEHEQAEQAKRDRLAQAEQEGREAAAARARAAGPTQPSRPASTTSQASSTGAERGWFEEAIDHISNFKGSAGNLLDWWRNQRAQRQLLTLEQQTRISHIYNGKINDLGGLE